MSEKTTVHRSHGAIAIDAAVLVTDLRELIRSARQRVATVAKPSRPFSTGEWGDEFASKFWVETGLYMAGRLS